MSVRSFYSYIFADDELKANIKSQPQLGLATLANLTNRQHRFRANQPNNVHLLLTGITSGAQSHIKLILFSMLTINTLSLGRFVLVAENSSFSFAVKTQKTFLVSSGEINVWSCSQLTAHVCCNEAQRPSSTFMTSCRDFHNKCGSAVWAHKAHFLREKKNLKPDQTSDGGPTPIARKNTEPAGASMGLHFLSLQNKRSQREFLLQMHHLFK